MNVFTWFTDEVIDPVGALIKAGVSSAEAEIKKLAGIAATVIPVAPAQSPPVVAFETAAQTTIDGLITSLVGQVPVEGQALSAAAVQEANTFLAYLEKDGGAFLNKAAAGLKAKLAQYAAA